MSKCLCGADLPTPSGPGRRPQFCSERCANKHRKQRQRERNIQHQHVTEIKREVTEKRELRSPLKRIGGKSAAAERIVSLFPAPSSYTRYCEPCGGAAHVLLAKPRARQHEEIFNDLDSNLIAFWMEMLVNADGMQSWLEKMPYSYELYSTYYRSLFDESELSQFERAWRYFYCLRQTGTGWLRKSKVGWDCRSNNLRSFRSAIETFKVVQERLQGVVIDNRDVLDTIRRYDSPNTFFYLDTPYFGAEQYYETSKKGFPHEKLAALLQNIQGQAAFSCYPHQYLDNWYPVERWRRVTWRQYKSSDIQSATPALATEMVLCNYHSTDVTLWEVS